MSSFAAAVRALPLALLTGCYGAPLESSICTSKNVVDAPLAGSWIATDPHRRQWNLRLERSGAGLFDVELTDSDKDDPMRYRGRLCVARVGRDEFASVRMEFSSRYFLYRLNRRGGDDYEASAFAADDDQDISRDVEASLRRVSKKAKIRCEQPFLNDSRCDDKYLSISQDELARIVTTAQGASLFMPMFHMLRDRSGEK